MQSIFYFISLSNGVVIFSAFGNIYSGGLFLLTNKNLESAGTCGFQTKFRQIALSDALLTFLATAAPSVAKTCHQVIMGSTHFLHLRVEVIMYSHTRALYSHMRTLCFCAEPFHIRSCAQDKTATVFKDDEHLD